jgi:imidazolonepropionase-like amidohydrolase
MTSRILGLIMFIAVETAAAADPVLRIEHVTIVSPEREQPMPDATVTIRDGRILSVAARSGPPASASAGVTVVDGRGRFLIPGLIDSHVHTGAVNGMRPQDEAAHPEIAKAARDQISRSYLYFGFTTLIDLDSNPEAMTRWNANDVRPDSFFCGGAPVVDGYPTMWEPKEQRYQRRYLIVQKGDEAKVPKSVDPAAHTPAAVVSRMKADGMYCVKAFYDERAIGPDQIPPVPTLETLRALVRSGHAAHMPVFVHALSTEAQSMALRAGADVIAHGLWEWNGEAGAVDLPSKVRGVLDEVLRKQVAWQPTMQVGYGFRDLYDPGYLARSELASVLPVALIGWYGTKEGQWFRNQVASGLPKDVAAMTPDARWNWVRSEPAYLAMFSRLSRTTQYLVSHNGHVIFGTDSPCAPLYTNPPGLNGWTEMHHLAEAGLTPVQIFRAATLVNAQAIQLSDEIGTVEAGKRANLLLVRQDPTQTIEAYNDIEKVILRGHVINRDELSAKRGSRSP